MSADPVRTPEAIGQEVLALLTDANSWRELRRQLAGTVPESKIIPQTIADIIIDVAVRQDLIKAMLDSAVRLETLAQEFAASLCLIPPLAPAPHVPQVGPLAPMTPAIDTIAPPLNPVAAFFEASGPDAQAAALSPTLATGRRDRKASPRLAPVKPSTRSRLANLRESVRVKTLEGWKAPAIAADLGAGLSTAYTMIGDMRRTGDLPSEPFRRGGSRADDNGA